MSPSRKILIAALTLILSQTVFSQQPSGRGGPAPAAKTAPRADDEAAAQARRVAVLRVQGFVDRALKFENIRAKTFTLADLADLLWKYDEAYARQVFLKALESLPRESSAGGAANQEGAEPDTVYLRSEIIARIARHDAALAKRLTDERASSTSREDLRYSDTLTAIRVMQDNPSSAAEFAERSLSHGVSDMLVGVLFGLRRRDEAAANGLFLKAVGSLLAQPSVDANDLLWLGAYVFTAPDSDPSEYRGIEMVTVGNNMVVNLMADRPNAPPELVRAYLDAAATILTRPVSDPQQRQLYYVAGYLLLPRVQRLLPSRAPFLAAAMQALATNIPPELSQATTYKKLADTGEVNVQATAEEIDAITDEGRHDDRCLSVAHQLYMSRSFRDARVFAAKIRDAELRAQVNNVILFGEAAAALERRNTAQAEEAAPKLSPGVESAVLWMGIGHARALEGNRVQASDALNAAVRDARRLDNAEAPLIILAAAGELARFAPFDAMQTLSEAVRAFNQRDASAMITWRRAIKSKGAIREFPLEVPGVRFGFGQALLPLVAANPESMIDLILGLKSDEQLGQALVATSAALLSPPPTAPR